MGRVLLLGSAMMAAVLGPLANAALAQRVTEGLIALYDFNEGVGTRVRDTSGYGEPLDLFFDRQDWLTGRVYWGDSFLAINRGSSEEKTDGTTSPIQSRGPASKLYDAIVNPNPDPTNAFTIEAWVTPARDGSPRYDLNSDPARVVSMSLDHGSRNFTLGQQAPGDRWVSRIRNSETGRNGTGGGIGQMETPRGSVELEAITHVVLTRDADGTETIYYHEEGAAFGNFVDRVVPGTLTGGGGGPESTDWNPAYGLALGDETNVAGGKWVGDFYLVAIYDQALTVEQVRENFAMGPYTESPMWLRPGDADEDFDFDQLDLVKVFLAGKYLTGEPATWGEGDWDGGPGGSPGNPPPGNEVFDTEDIVAALAEGWMTSGPRAVAGHDVVQDGKTSVGYNAMTGAVWVDTPAGIELTSIRIDSARGIFTGDTAQNLGGRFDHDGSGSLFKATFGSSFGSMTFGNVAQTGLDREFVLGDLSVVASLAGGGTFGHVDLIYVPVAEPSSIALLVLAVFVVALSRRNAGPD